MTFEEIYQIDVNDKLEKKDDLYYLSWAYAVAEFTKIFKDFKYEIKMFDNLPYTYDENTGYMVFTSITANGRTCDMWLPVMDSSNKAMKKEKYTIKTKWGEKEVQPATMFDVNKTIMRCLVKNMAMFGLGLKVYAGEDLPDSEDTVEEVKKTFTQAKEIKTPTIDEVKEYLMNKQYTTFSANKFFNYYDNLGWKSKDGKPITDWQKLADVWNKKQLENDNKTYEKLATKGAKNV